MDDGDLKGVSTHLSKLWNMKIWKDPIMVNFKRCTRYYVAYRVSVSFSKFTSISAHSDRNVKESRKLVSHYK